jgi:ribosomal-protein-alanine N-acetyltransferase
VSATPVLTSERLALRPFDEGDAGFILELVNDAEWLRYIGDKQVQSLDDARRYLRDGPIAMQARHGHGLCRVERRSDGQPVGMCGLLRRDTLDDVDLGFAFLPCGRGQGFAREAAAAMLAHGFAHLALPRIVAITDLDNAASARVLEAIGMRFERILEPGPAPGAKPLRLFCAESSTPSPTTAARRREP